MTLEVALPVNTFAGDLQIDVQQDSFPTSSFTLPGSNGTATFGFQSIQSPGFTAYVVSDVSSALINLSGLNQFTLPGIGNTCVIIRDLSTPETPEITRSTSASCP